MWIFLDNHLGTGINHLRQSRGAAPLSSASLTISASSFAINASLCSQQEQQRGQVVGPHDGDVSGRPRLFGRRAHPSGVETTVAALVRTLPRCPCWAELAITRRLSTQRIRRHDPSVTSQTPPQPMRRRVIVALIRSLPRMPCCSTLIVTPRGPEIYDQ